MQDSQASKQSSLSSPSLGLNDISLSLSSSQRRLVLSPVPRVPLPPQRISYKASRPSTASSIIDRRPGLLPSTRSSGSQSESNSRLSSPRLDLAPVWPNIDPQFHGSKPDSKNTMPTSKQTGRNHDDEGDLYGDSRHRSMLDFLPTVFDSSTPGEEYHLAPTAPQEKLEASEADYDWATFISAYAAGKWDPHKTPHPPRSLLHQPTLMRTSVSETPGSATLQRVFEQHIPEDNEYSGEGPSIESLVHSSDSASATYTIPQAQNSSPTKFVGTTDIRLPKPDRSQSLNITQFPHRLRNSSADIRSSSSSQMNMESEVTSCPIAADIITTAATIRWAGARVSVAPLALPSPEHELTDPMRGVNAAIPGSHPLELAPETSITPLSPGRRTRLASFWQGTQDIDSENLNRPRISESQSTVEPEPLSLGSFPTSAGLTQSVDPSRPTAEVKVEDYFNDFGSPSPPSSSGHGRTLLARHESFNLQEIDDINSVSAIPRKICLARQTSSPLISVSLNDRPPKNTRGTRSSSDSSTRTQSRAAKEEQMFADLGYLVPPNPPNELERRRALYRFNIWHTGTDPSFQRIAYLVKLVFNTKIVMISLIDGNEEWMKSELGIGNRTLPRTSSFCAHAILQRGDEPTVVLDTLDDWRFAKNPLVTGSPNIRFYAGAPLKTHEGFNVGTLSIVDDVPRSEFSPRQRHTLKEFATIAMREMELWRDKIQLRIRDRIQNSMEQFTRECLEIDREADGDKTRGLSMSPSMDQIYERAAKLVKRTLDVEGAIVMDVSHCQVLETMSAESTVSVVLHNADPQMPPDIKSLSAEEYKKLTEFFAKYPEGRISEGIVPAPCRPFLPTHCQYALTVPIFNIDKRPFALLCAYNAGDHTTPFLEGHELSYLRAIGVIILSAVLKRRMILADKAKGLFISNISHELRTPLHGILASAELLSDTPLNHSQMSFLDTVQACGTSLVETVNHVLDFTKLSGNARSGGLDNVILPTRVDLMQLVEEAVEGCWIGHRARMFTSEIGSVYSPPDKQGRTLPPDKNHVETIIDIGPNSQNWTLVFEKGGIRRVLMNLFGNSLKFTTDGYVHLMIRRTYPINLPLDKVRIELSVSDTGKGISQDFLKNQLFHPFSQENPMQTGTGLGLAIVNSIIRSSSVDGKVDVWSSENVGTEIKVTFTADAVKDEDSSSPLSELWRPCDFSCPPTVTLINFDDPHRGVRLLKDVLSEYVTSWWHMKILPESSDPGDIVIVNEDPGAIADALSCKDISRTFVLLSSGRGDPHLMALVNDYENIGGFCRILYKPGGPSRLHATLKLCLRSLLIGRKFKVNSLNIGEAGSSRAQMVISEKYETVNGAEKPHSDSDGGRDPLRPWPETRSITFEPSPDMLPDTKQAQVSLDPPEEKTAFSTPMISIGSGGMLLKSSVGSITPETRARRVLVVEDNHILRDLLVKWLNTKGYEPRGAVDGRDGVRTFESDGHFDIVLLDMSMPELDGIGATKEIRDIESRTPGMPGTRILALTGMSTLEDKRKAFEAGVDGYLVKPVAFKTLDEMFHRLGVP